MFKYLVIAMTMFSAVSVAQVSNEHQRLYAESTSASSNRNAHETLKIKKEVIEVYNDIGITSVSGRMLIDLLSFLSKNDNKYEYRYSNVTGAGGEAAITQAVAKSRAGSKVLIYTGIGAFTFNRDQSTLQNMVEYDKDKDFILMQTVASNQFGVIVNNERPFSKIDDLLAHIRQSKEPVFIGKTSSAGTTALLSDIFLDHYKLRDKVKLVRYSKIGDMVFGLQNKEILFAVHSPTEFSQSKPLLMGGFNRSPNYPDVPTGSEIGFTDFALESLTLFFAPRDQAQLAMEVLPVIRKICSETEASKIISDAKRTQICMGTREIVSYIDRERKAIERSRKQ
jgi:tripartite-type tricarboxylate transporter receptor subunit TctC